ncbi:hypothetical protein FJZ36_19055, partial [Candidatus Poribacteria bacterium]|nr:hypothetical protein [Candidatus Poribacteria bacterium]
MKRHVFAILNLSESMPSGGEPVVSSVQLLRAGTFQHGWYGRIQINADLYDALIRNFDERARGIDVALDVEHQPEHGAAGWFRRLWTDPDGEELWGEVEWTSKGRELVEEGIFKYLSIEYDLAYVDESGVLRGPTMLGAALTNRPFLKQMREATINLSEPDAFAEGEETEIALTDRESAFLSETVRLREENARLRAALARQRAESRLAEAKREGRVTPAMEGWLRELAELDDERFERVVRTLPVQVVFDEMGSAGEGEVS